MRNYVSIVALTIFVGLAKAAVYYVDNGHLQASNSNPGTLDSPWLTLDHAQSRASQPGDIVYVRSGTYNEQSSLSHSGSAEGGHIHFVGYPGDSKPVCRGFTMSGQSYIKIIGFEITHITTNYNHAITINNSHHIEILDNYIHHHRGHSVKWYNMESSYVTVRGNEMYMAQCPSADGTCFGNGWAVQMRGGAGYNLVEYNRASRVGDFINVKTPFSIIRNNYLVDYADSYWPNSSSSIHCDIFQPFGQSQYQIYEANFMGDNREQHSHLLQMRNATENDDMHHILFRGNVGFNFGSYAMQAGGVDNVYYYNNTIDDVNKLITWEGGVIRHNNEGSDLSIGNHNFNNIYSRNNSGGPPIVVDAGGNELTASHNLCYETASHESCASEGDPRYGNAARRDYYPQAGSPAIGLGKPVTVVTSAPGEGETFEVAQSDMFTDGYGIAEGDLIRVGQGPMVRITSITGNTLTVNGTVSWEMGSGVFWRLQDTSPDAGAYEYDDRGYEFGIELLSPLHNGEVKGTIPIMAQAMRPDLIRFVVIYINGIPTAKITDAPYVYVWDATNGKVGNRYTIEARAYGLYAGPNPVVSDTALVTQTSLTEIEKTQSGAGKGDLLDYQGYPGKRLIVFRPALSNGLSSESSLEIINSKGRLMTRLNFSNGEANWHYGDAPSGVYLASLELPTGRMTRPFLIFP